MNDPYRSGAVLTALGVALTPTLAAAAPTTMLEKSATYAFDKEFHSFRVPTTDSTGKIKYYDVVIKLTVGTTGVISPTATVTATLSPSPPTSQVIVPGTYKASDNTVCTVTNFNLTSGRIQSHFSCNTPTNLLWEMEVTTGTISSGHPYLTQLVAAGIDKLIDAATYSWGIVTTGNGKVAVCDYFNEDYVVGVKTNGNQIIPSIFYYNDPADFRCGGTLVKQ